MTNFQLEKGDSAGKGRELLLDTQGACFLCLQDPSRGGDNDSSGNGEIGLEEVNLRDICRYLGIRGLGKSSLKGRGGGSTEFVVELCGKCGVHVNQLSERIRVLEEAVRGISKELQEIQVVLKGCKEREECKLQWEKILENNSMDARIIDCLREETIQKGSEKLKILNATKTTPPTRLNQSLGKSSSNLGTSETAANSDAPNPTPMSASSLKNRLSSTASTVGGLVSPPMEILISGAKAPPTRLMNSSGRASSNMNKVDEVNSSGSGMEPETEATSTTSNRMPASPTAPAPTSAATCGVPMSHSSDPDSSIEIVYDGTCSATATRTTCISKAPAPPTQLIDSSARVSSNLNQMDEVNVSGGGMEPETVATFTVPNPTPTSVTMEPPVASSTTPIMFPSSDLNSPISIETPSTASPSIKGRRRKYRGPANLIFSRSYHASWPDEESGVPQFHCHHCKAIVKKDSSLIRNHILAKHPESLFTNVTRLSPLEFKKCVDKLLSSELETLILKNSNTSYQCKLCKLSFRNMRNCKYHLVMKHYSILEKKLEGLQRGVGCETKKVGGSLADEGRDELSLSKGRVGQKKVAARFECLVWSGGCGKIFSEVEALRMHEEVCKRGVVGGTLEVAPGERKMQNSNDGGNLRERKALVKWKGNVGVNGGYPKRRSARLETSGERSSIYQPSSKSLQVSPPSLQNEINQPSNGGDGAPVSKKKRNHKTESPVIIQHHIVRPFTGNHRRKSFPRRGTLPDLHQKTHTGKRSYRCDQCSSTFLRPQHLERHLLVHSDLRPFKCGICRRTFTRKDNLERHIGRTHKLSLSRYNSIILH